MFSYTGNLPRYKIAKTFYSSNSGSFGTFLIVILIQQAPGSANILEQTSSESASPLHIVEATNGLAGAGFEF